MKIGLVFPQTEIGPDPSAVCDFAQTAEDLGYKYLLAYDHVLGAFPDRPNWRGRQGPYKHHHLFHEVFVLFGYLAGLTQTIELTTGILILPQRQTALVAKQAAEVDVLSGGRLRLGIGVGWNDAEYESLGEDFANRGKRSEEQVRLLKALWTQERVEFEGDHHQVYGVGINPLPVQQPIPVWFGGGAPAVLRRMAELGDGWMLNRIEMADVPNLRDQILGHLAEAGRDPAEFGFDVRIVLGQIPQRDWSVHLNIWRELGITHLGINTMGQGFDSPQDHLDFIRTVAETIGLTE